MNAIEQSGKTGIGGMVWQGWLSWGLQAVAALILAQTLYFKFRAAPESVYIFETVGAEPWGRILSGVVELVAAVLLLMPRLSWVGAALGLAVICGAILSHIFILGLVVLDDGGLLFGLAVTVFVCCLSILYLRRSDWSKYVSK